MLITPWIFIRFIANLVRECTFIHSLLVLNIDTMELQVCVLWQFLQSVQKEIKALWPPYSEEKKMKELNETLATHIADTAREISFKFGTWHGLPGGNLCSDTSSNRIKDHGATKA